MKSATFPGFNHRAEDLSAYGLSLEVFFISLTSGEIIRFVAPDPEVFKKWLNDNGVRNIAATSVATRTTIIVKRRRNV